MSAICYWCSVPGTDKIANPIGKKNHPFACCRVCQVFTCGDHGVRDDDTKEFVCFDCDTQGLCEMAVANTQASIKTEKGSADATILAFQLQNMLFRNRRVPRRLFLKSEISFAEFAETRPGYRDWLERYSYIFSGDTNFEQTFPNMTDEEADVFLRLPDDARNFLILAGIILSMVYAEGIPDSYPSLLQHLSINVMA